MNRMMNVLAASLCACSLPVLAQTLQNGDFETAAIADGTAAHGVAASWGPGLLVNPDADGTAVLSSFVSYSGLPQAFSGNQYANIGTWLENGLEQTFTVEQTGRYAVTWADNSLFFPAQSAQAAYQVSFSLGAQFIAAQFDAYHQGEWREHQTSAVLTPGIWTLRFYATRVIGSQATISLIDDVRISPIPEPAAAPLLALGLAALAWRRRRVAPGA